MLKISSSGFAFFIERQQQHDFIVDEVIKTEIYLEEKLALKIPGNIRHISKIRGMKGTKFHRRVQADLVTRELADLSNDSGIEPLISFASAPSFYNLEQKRIFCRIKNGKVRHT